MNDNQCAIGAESQITRSLQVRNSNFELLRIDIKENERGV